jgi:hypothetical protein
MAHCFIMNFEREPPRRSTTRSSRTWASTIGPLIARHGIREPRITSFPVHEVRRADPQPVTFLHVVWLPGADAASFAALNEKSGPRPPDGQIFHANGPLDDGWATVGFWTSKQARDRFIQERILPPWPARGCSRRSRISSCTTH